MAQILEKLVFENLDICQKYLSNNSKMYEQTLFTKFFLNIIWEIYDQMELKL